MARLLRMPAVAANATEAVLAGWPVAEGEAFSATDTLATVETEKAVVDVEAETDGVILKTLVAAGAEVEVGAPIAILGDAGEVIDDLDAILADLGVEPPAAAALEAEPAPADAPAEAPSVTAGQTNGAPVSATVAASAVPVAHASDGMVADRLPGARIFASPLARRLAKNAGLGLDQIVGTGPGGRIVRRDVDAAAAGRRTAPAATAPSPATAPPVPATTAAAFTDTPPSRIRKAIAARLTQSKQSTPHFYLRGTAKVDALLAARAELNEVSPTKISINDMVIKAVARAHVLVPAVNTIWLDDVIRSFSSVDVAVAVATDRGLVTPVLRAVEAMPISQVAATVQDFVARAKAGTLRQEELEGGAVSITNLGMYGTEEFAAIINPPQSAILAVGAAQAEPVVVDGEIRAATVMRVTLSVDHRAIDGALAADWMRTFIGLLEHPVRIFA